jgi:hypothetical protein
LSGYGADAETPAPLAAGCELCRSFLTPPAQSIMADVNNTS